MAPMRVAMRADASLAIGTGHVARCLTLAAAIRARGGQVRVVGRGLPAHLQEWVRSAGHECAVLDGPVEAPDRDLAHGEWLGTSQAGDARDTIAALADATWDWMVVDHYAIDAQWERALRATVRRVLIIDDLADRDHDCDLLLDQNLPADASRYTPRVPPGAGVLAGPAYALLRDEFRAARERAQPRDGEIRRVLVFMGGGDADNHTAHAVEACIRAGLTAGQVDVVIGAGHAHQGDIEAACAAAGYTCHVQTARMADLMVMADLAIGASGSASWERCAVGLPAVALSAAVNQDRILEGLSAHGAAIAVSADTEAMTDALVRARRSPVLVHAMSESAWHLVDGAGAARVCDAMESRA